MNSWKLQKPISKKMTQYVFSLSIISIVCTYYLKIPISSQHFSLNFSLNFKISEGLESKCSNLLSCALKHWFKNLVWMLINSRWEFSVKSFELISNFEIIMLSNMKMQKSLWSCSSCMTSPDVFLLNFSKIRPSTISNVFLYDLIFFMVFYGFGCVPGCGSL